jgi:CPA2 family monovalent cation:H+ antiporter-2
LAELGIGLLLFGIGLELPFERVKQLWKAAAVGGGLQVLLTGAVAYAVARGAGASPAAALLFAFVVVPSSTAIVLRALDAKGEVDAPHGKLMLGVLLFQDFCLVPMMLVLTALSRGDEGEVWPALGRSTLMLALIASAARLLVPRLLHVVAAARQRDVFVLAVVMVSIGTAWAASMAGVSLAIGAFLAGVVVAGSEYRHQVAGELIPLREVFASLFFVSAGMLLDLRAALTALYDVLGLLCLLVLGKAAVMLLIAGLMRVPLRAAVVASVGLAQVGEFALVMIGTTHGRGFWAPRFEGTLLSAIILSMLGTPLLMALAPRVAGLALRLRYLTRLFPEHARRPKLGKRRSHEEHVVLAGYGVAGRALAARLIAERVEVVVVDLNAKLVHAAKQDGFAAYFGDVASPELLDHVGIGRARQVVLLINDPSALERAVVSIRRSAPQVTILVRTRYQGDVARLSSLGADAVIAAEVEAGRAVIEEVVARHSAEPPPPR